jgi:putative oligomerization/nucleic acid binding protein
VRMRVSPSSAMLLLTGCAGPPGLPFGPGPEGDALFGILVILLFAGFLHRAAKGCQNSKHFDPPALRLAHERYARGELTREEFQNMMRDLSAPPNGIQ